MNTTRIIKEVEKQHFKDMIQRHITRIEISPHAFDHPNHAQRKLLTQDDLLSAVKYEEPRGVGIQKNGRFAAFYRRKNGFIKIICEEKKTRFEIIIFINVDYMPNLIRLK